MAIRDFTASVRMIFKDEFSAQADSARASLNGLTSGLNEMSSGSSALQTASQLSLVAGHAERMSQSINQAMAAPSNAASELESALAAASTVVTPELAIDGDFEKTMDYLRGKALNWAAGITEGSQKAEASAAKYAQTTYNMLSAGLEAEAAANATEQALLLAKATMGDSSDAASLLAIAYNTMGDKSKDSRQELQRLSDVVAKTQAAFQIADLTQLNNGLKYGIPAAQKYKVAWAEMSTVIGQLNTSGLTDSMAGTSFSSMMSQMIKGQQKLGFKIAYNEDGSMSVINTLNNIRDKFGEVDSWNERTISAFNTVFGERGSRALTLLLTSLDSLESNYEAVAASEGQTEMMASRMSDTYADTIAVMNNAREAMLTRIGTATNRTQAMFAKVKTSFYNMASSILDTKFGGVFASLIANGGIAASKLLALGSSGLNVVTQLVTIAALGSQAGGVMKVLASAGSLLVAPLKLLGTAFLGLAKGIWAALAPALPFIAIAAAIAVAAYLIIKNWEPIKKFFTNLWEGIKEKASAFWGKIKTFASNAKEKVVAAWDKTKGFFSNLWENIKGKAASAWAGVKSFASNARDKVASAWGATKTFFSNLWGSIKEKAASTWDNVKSFASNAKEKVTSAWEGAKGFFSGLWDNIKGKAVSAWANLSARAPGFTSAIETVWGGLKGFYGGLWEGIKGTATNFWNILTGQSELSLSAFTEPWNKLGEFFTGIWDGVKGVFSTAWDWVKKPFEKIGEWLGIKKDDPLEVTASAVASSDALTSAVAGQMQAASEYIPHSDAKRGPMSRLTAAGAAIPKTMAKGLRGGIRSLTESEDSFSLVEPAVKSSGSSSEGSSRVATFLQSIDDKLSEILSRMLKRGASAGIRIENINLPDVNDIHAVIRFVDDLRAQLENAEVVA